VAAAHRLTRTSSGLGSQPRSRQYFRYAEPSRVPNGPPERAVISLSVSRLIEGGGPFLAGFDETTCPRPRAISEQTARTVTSEDVGSLRMLRKAAPSALIEMWNGEVAFLGQQPPQRSADSGSGRSARPSDLWRAEDRDFLRIRRRSSAKPDVALAGQSRRRPRGTEVFCSGGGVRRGVFGVFISHGARTRPVARTSPEGWSAGCEQCGSTSTRLTVGDACSSASKMALRGEPVEASVVLSESVFAKHWPKQSSTLLPRRSRRLARSDCRCGTGSASTISHATKHRCSLTGSVFRLIRALYMWSRSGGGPQALAKGAWPGQRHGKSEAVFRSARPAIRTRGCPRSDGRQHGVLGRAWFSPRHRRIGSNDSTRG